MSDLHQIVEHYFAAWNEADRARRLEHIATAWAPTAHYVDPISDVTGHDGFDAMIEGLQAQYPGHTVQRTSAIERHHDHVRFEWEIVDTDGARFVAGVDYGELAPDGRLQSVTGFFGTAVPEEDAA